MKALLEIVHRRDEARDVLHVGKEHQTHPSRHRVDGYRMPA